MAKDDYRVIVYAENSEWMQAIIKMKKESQIKKRR